MSYDVAVWAGPRPLDDEAAGEEFERRADEADAAVDAGDDEPASPTIQAFVADLLARYPDLGEPGDERSPWASGPLLADGTGDFVCINMTFSGAEEGVPFVAEVASKHGLVCYDPQAEGLI